MNLFLFAVVRNSRHSALVENIFLAERVFVGLNQAIELLQIKLLRNLIISFIN